MKNLLSRWLKAIVPVLCHAYGNFFFASRQAFVRLIGELIKWHTDLPTILDVGLVLFVMEFG